MKQAQFPSSSRTSYTYHFADGTTSTVHIGDIDENGVVVTEEMIAFLHSLDEKDHYSEHSACAVEKKEQDRLIKGVYDTLTGRHVNVPVREDVYHEYMRGLETIKEQNKRFYAHEIQMSQLVGGEDGSYDNFSEFVSSEDDPYKTMVHRTLLDVLRQEMEHMTPAEQDLIDAIFFENLSEREYSEISGLPQKTINNRKRTILRRLKEKMKKY